MINQLEEKVVSGESEITFSETEIEAAEQLVHLSEEETMSCSSGTGWSVCGSGNTKIQEDVVSSKVRYVVGKEQNDGVWWKQNVTDGKSTAMKAIMETKTRRNKKRKFRSIANIYKATKEMKRE